ncbi:hypothetical protein, partial [Pseudomonas savastanoi]|uniref:hypothetical protein n=1 Tax=Pseudomonas savastanoi TaxID=29438 RepID=UPI001CB78DD7
RNPGRFNGVDIVQVLGDKGVHLNLANAGVEVAQGGEVTTPLLAVGPAPFICVAVTAMTC